MRMALVEVSNNAGQTGLQVGGLMHLLIGRRDNGKVQRKFN
jgi:hypothetical protein